MGCGGNCAKVCNACQKVHDSISEVISLGTSTESIAKLKGNIENSGIDFPICGLFYVRTQCANRGKGLSSNLLRCFAEEKIIDLEMKLKKGDELFLKVFYGELTLEDLLGLAASGKAVMTPETVSAVIERPIVSDCEKGNMYTFLTKVREGMIDVIPPITKQSGLETKILSLSKNYNI